MNECAREITWAGGTHIFNLNDKRVLQIIDLLGLPGQYGDTPAACLKRFEETVYSNADVERIIELGLIGGGMSEQDTDDLLTAHVRLKPIAPLAVVAFTILAALFVGAATDA